MPLESAESCSVILLLFSHFSQKPVFFRPKSAKPDAVLYSRFFEHLSSIKLAENGRKFADKTAWYRLYFQRLHNAAQNSKSGSLHGLVGSNPTASAKEAPQFWYNGYQDCGAFLLPESPDFTDFLTFEVYTAPGRTITRCRSSPWRHRMAEGNRLFFGYRLICGLPFIFT